MSDTLLIRQMELGPMQNFIYLIGDPVSREAAVIDPGWEVPKILEQARRDELTIKHILVTHNHFDHINGIAALLEETDAIVHAHREDAEGLTMEVAPSSIHQVSGGDIVQVGQVPVTLVHTPGHTPGSQCVHVHDRLLTGDTLFIRACGRTDLPGGDPAELYRSLATLKKMDDHTHVLPGHNYADKPTSTLAEEKRENPFLQFQALDEFLRLVGT
ncbi:MAG: MBL fold metallo-hydrolase [Candidatus Omnitrophica bacterium]|nr:MBL fold metallo-hydrolase [Candidatus Omnitrophota bacterium]